MMRVGVITYDRGHRKTAEVTRKLILRGHQVTLFAFPFIQRDPKPDAPYPDRPPQLIDYSLDEFAKQHHVTVARVPGWDDNFSSVFRDMDAVLHCTAKIVPPSFVKQARILNCHPGLLPRNRGVDAFKWSIIKGWPIGVTLHAIDRYIDRGIILYRRAVPILASDTLADVCQRAYDFEVDLLASFDAHLHNLGRDWQVGDEHPISHKRIPRALDHDLETIFQGMKSQLMVAAMHREVLDYP